MAIIPLLFYGGPYNILLPQRHRIVGVARREKNRKEGAGVQKCVHARGDPGK